MLGDQRPGPELSRTSQGVTRKPRGMDTVHGIAGDTANRNEADIGKSRLTGRLANCLKRRNISSSHFQKAAQECPRKAPVRGFIGHTHKQKDGLPIRFRVPGLGEANVQEGHILP